MPAADYQAWIAVEVARAQREGLARIEASQRADQKGEAFSDLDD